MKILSILAVALAFVCNVEAQNMMKLVNATNCPLMFETVHVTSGTCAGGTIVFTPVPAGVAIAITAPAGEEFIAAKVYDDPTCAGGVLFGIGTPMNCYSTCSWGTASSAVQTQNGCGGCLPTINAKWDDCHAPGVGILTVIDF